MKALRRRLAEMGVNVPALWEDIHSVVIKTLVAIEAQVRCSAHRVKLSAAAVHSNVACSVVYRRTLFAESSAFKERPLDIHLARVRLRLQVSAAVELLAIRSGTCFEVSWNSRTKHPCHSMSLVPREMLSKVSCFSECDLEKNGFSVRCGEEVARINL